MKEGLLVLLRSIRWPNLLITLASLIISQYLLLIPISKLYDFEIYLDPLSFSLLCFSVIFIMAGGYIINDYFDVDTDHANSKFNISRQIGPSKTLIIYLLLTIVGIIYGLLLAIRIDMIQLWSIQLFAALLLLIYSRFLNSIPLVGNLSVSFLCALIIVLPLINAAGGLSKVFDPAYYIIHFLSILAFLTTLVREIVKDLQDFNGDEKSGKLTLPVVLGKTGSRSLAVVLQSMLILFLISITHQFSDQSYWNLIYLSLLLLLPSLVIFTLLIFARTEDNFHRISKALKLMMVLALIYGITYNSIFLCSH